MDSYLKALATVAISASISCTPLFLLAGWRRSGPLLRVSVFAWLLFVLDGAAVHLPPVFGASGISWAIEGKLLQLLVFVPIALRWSRQELRWPTGGWFGYVIAVALVTLLPSLVTGLPGGLPSYGWYLYQATLPGLAEEIIYRGVILSILDQVFEGPITLLGAAWGWGALVTSSQFYLAHCLSLDEAWNVVVALEALPDFAFYGLAMCWLRYRFESVWPSVLAHNLHNVLLITLAWV